MSFILISFSQVDSDVLEKILALKGLLYEEKKSVIINFAGNNSSEPLRGGESTKIYIINCPFLHLNVSLNRKRKRKMVVF